MWTKPTLGEIANKAHILWLSSWFVHKHMHLTESEDTIQYHSKCNKLLYNKYMHTRQSSVSDTNLRCTTNMHWTVKTQQSIENKRATGRQFKCYNILHLGWLAYHDHLWSHAYHNLLAHGYRDHYRGNHLVMIPLTSKPSPSQQDWHFMHIMTPYTWRLSWLWV